MLRAFDCAQPLTSAVIGRAAVAGFQAVGRYYGSPGSGKLLTLAEARRISAGGLAIFCYFERTAGRPLLGDTAGAADGALAAQQAAAAGQPEGAGICFAIDTDVDMDDRGQREAVVAYFRAARNQLAGRYRLGVYGDGEACAALFAASLVDYEILAGAMGWQGSRAYRDGKLWEGMQYPELAASRSPIGINLDPVDLVSLAAVGAWSTAGAATDQAPPPGKLVGADRSTPVDIVSEVVKLQQDLAALGLYTGEVDGRVGPQTAAAAMRAFHLTRG
jgi:hypothetical protein